MILSVGSTVLALLDLLGAWLISRLSPKGWVIALLTEFLWTPYNIITRQYGFLILTTISIPVSVRGYRNLSRQARSPNEAA